jgi:hypothetical protein
MKLQLLWSSLRIPPSLWRLGPKSLTSGKAAMLGQQQQQQQPQLLNQQRRRRPRRAHSASSFITRHSQLFQRCPALAPVALLHCVVICRGSFVFHSPAPSA